MPKKQPDREAPTNSRNARASTRSEQTDDGKPALRSEGQRLLRELTATGGGSDVAARVGVTKGLVSLWRSGAKSPGPAVRAELERELGIPAAAWSQTPTAGTARPGTPSTARQRAPGRRVAPQVPAPAVPASEGEPTTLEAVRETLEELDRLAATDGLLPELVLKIRGERIKALSLKARLEREAAEVERKARAEADALEADAVLKNPRWRAVRDAVERVLLERWPDAYRAVMDELASAEG